MPPIDLKGRGIKLFLVSSLAVTYAFAIAYYPDVAGASGGRPYFAETYFGSVAASAALSFILLIAGAGVRRYVLLGLRIYLILVLGYSIGGFLSVKLALGIGLALEIAFLVEYPRSAALAALAVALLGAAQAWPVFFGASAIASTPAFPTFVDLSALCLVLALVSATAIWVGRLEGRRAELEESLALQEANLDTLAELNRNLQGYARTVDEESTERERHRISREIHDISGYIFTNLIALLDAAGSMPKDDQGGLSDMLLTARTQAQEGLRETRVALRKLRAERPPSDDCVRGVYKIVTIFRKVARLEVALSFGNLPRTLPHELSMALYRTVQESLTNAIRHGKARRVRISFWIDDGGNLLLTIADDGKGAFEVVKGIGLSGMEERVGSLGGTVRVGPAPEGGFTVGVSIPLRREV